MGYHDVRVVPPVGDIHRLANVASDPATEAWMAQLERPILLSVAQLMPHKRPDFLVQARTSPRPTRACAVHCSWSDTIASIATPAPCEPKRAS